MEDPDRPAPHPRPNHKRRGSGPIRHSPKADRWIEAELAAICDHDLLVTAMIAEVTGLLRQRRTTPSARLTSKSRLTPTGLIHRDKSRPGEAGTIITVSFHPALTPSGRRGV